MRVCLGSIVEGDGEVQALPVLLRRIAAVELPGTVPTVLPPWRVSRGSLVHPVKGELERAVQAVAQKIKQQGAERNGLLVLLDSDDDKPCELGPSLLKRARQARGDMALSVVCACREYEAWFLAAADSLKGQCGLPESLSAPAHPEAIRDAKGWLNRQMPRGYAERTSQVELSKHLDLALARQRATSFDKLYRDVRRLLLGRAEAASG